MRTFVLILLTLAGTGFFAGVGDVLRAQSPAITVELTFDKDHYAVGEPVGATVTVRNDSGRDILVTKGFSTMTYYKEMRVVDPAGRLLLAKREEEHEEFPDAPPVPFILSKDGLPTQVAECEVLPAGWSRSIRADDLWANYPLKLPGDYSTQVQLSAMTFKRNELEAIDQCYGNINGHESLGAFKSETKYLYIAGSTEVDIIPKGWLHWWKNGLYFIDDIAVTVWPAQGKTVEDYRTDGIQLNNVAAKKVVKRYSFLKKKYYLLAFFDKREAIRSLGSFEVGKSYPVVISGMTKGNEFWGGGEKIEIIY